MAKRPACGGKNLRRKLADDVALDDAPPLCELENPMNVGEQNDSGVFSLPEVTAVYTAHNA
jgi:hypothetical protein